MLKEISMASFSYAKLHELLLLLLLGRLVLLELSLSLNGLQGLHHLGVLLLEALHLLQEGVPVVL